MSAPKTLRDIIDQAEEEVRKDYECDLCGAVSYGPRPPSGLCSSCRRGGSRADTPLISLLAEPTFDPGAPLVNGGQGRSEYRTVVSATIIGYVAALALGVLIGAML